MNKVKTTPENVAEANWALFRATMNLPAAAAHCLRGSVRFGRGPKNK